MSLATNLVTDITHNIDPGVLKDMGAVASSTNPDGSIENFSADGSIGNNVINMKSDGVTGGPKFDFTQAAHNIFSRPANDNKAGVANAPAPQPGRRPSPYAALNAKQQANFDRMKGAGLSRSLLNAYQRQAEKTNSLRPQMRMQRPELRAANKVLKRTAEQTAQFKARPNARLNRALRAKMPAHYASMKAPQPSPTRSISAAFMHAASDEMLKQLVPYSARVALGLVKHALTPSRPSNDGMAAPAPSRGRRKLLDLAA